MISEDSKNSASMMKILYRLTILVFAVSLLTGCVENLDKSHYRLECNIASGLGVDSVTLMLAYSHYQGVYNVVTVTRDPEAQAFVFEGNVEKACVAYLKFNNDSTPMLFVLEPGETKITIDANRLVISGGNGNHEYMTYLKKRKAMLDEKSRLHQEYLQALAPDSTITVLMEKQYLSRDSALTDSLEHITVNYINRGTLASDIIMDRFVNTLSKRNLQNIHKK